MSTFLRQALWYESVCGLCCLSRLSGPLNQTDQIDEMNQMDQFPAPRRVNVFLFLRGPQKSVLSLTPNPVQIRQIE
jgi:hypothetical protein